MQASEYIRRRDGFQRIGEHQKQAGQIGDRFDLLANAACDEGPAFKAHRHIRAECERKRCQSFRLYRNLPVPQKRPKGSRRIRRTAANAGGDRKVLFEVNGNRTA